MGWLAFGLIYSVVYFGAGLLFASGSVVAGWFRFAALLVPPLAGIAAIARQRGRWSGCQWLFWATIALGLALAAIGHIGWFLNGLLLKQETSWLHWHAVLVIFGNAAPLLALLAQPHRGPRDAAAATVAVDIAGIGVLIGFLYSYFVSAADLAGAAAPAYRSALYTLAEVQPLIVFVGMSAAAILARRDLWGSTYRRLALGLGINVIALTLSNIGIAQGLYRPWFVYDFVWILPFAFYPWAAAHAPSSEAACDGDMPLAHGPSRPWLILALLMLIPALEYVLRATVPSAYGGTRDLAAAVTVVSALPLLLARVAVERSEQRRMDDRLRLLVTAVEQADEGIIIRTIDRQFVYANDAYCRVLRCTREQLHGSDPRAFFDAESAAQSEAVVNDVRAGRAWRGTATRRRPDGTTFPAAVAVVPIGDEHGRITHLLSVEHDVTGEMALREQLIHSERLSAVGQLAAGVAHELNNPLQVVVGLTELALDTEPPEGLRTDLHQLKGEAMRAATIIRNLLGFVRHTPGSRASEDLNSIVEATVALRRYELGVANITVEERYGAALPRVRVNREEIQQIIVNLLLNAEHAILAHADSGTLRIETSASATEVRMEVADSGPGIPAEISAKIFEPFFSTKGVGEGTGLGLSIALGIAVAHGGSLTLAPEASGARFRLTLPAEENPVGA